MKKSNLLMLLMCMFLFLSCREESVYVEQESQNTSLKNYVLNDSEIKRDPKLWSKICEIQSKFFSGDINSKKGNTISDGAVILTNYAGVAESHGTTTYTFRIERINPSEDIENLVIRKTASGEYSELLIKYHLSKQEALAFLNGSTVQNIDRKMSVYKINDIQTSNGAKSGGYTYFEFLGCLMVTYQVIPCTSNQEHTNPNQCSLTGASAPQIILMSIDDTHCFPSGNPGGTSPGSSGTIPSNPGSGGGSQGSEPSGNSTLPQLLYNTFLFTNFGDETNICEPGNSSCEQNRQLNLQLQAYLMSLPPATSMLSSYLNTFITIKGYFSINGGDALLTERLNWMASWYNNPSNAGIPHIERDKFVSFGLDFLIQNPTITWEQFENWFAGTSEGQDFFYDENYWEDPSLSFPLQNLPSWNSFSAVYPNETSAQLYGLVGGEVAQAQVDYPIETRNGCALKVSRALNYSGVVIPNIPGKTVKGGDNKFYFLNAKALNAWMRKTFGISPNNPKHKNFTKLDGGIKGKNFPGLFKNKKGIFSMVSPQNSTWASGHADILYLNGTCKANCHFFDGDILYIDFWELN